METKYSNLYSKYSIIPPESPIIRPQNSIPNEILESLDLGGSSLMLSKSSTRSLFIGNIHSSKIDNKITGEGSGVLGKSRLVSGNEFHFQFEKSPSIDEILRSRNKSDWLLKLFQNFQKFLNKGYLHCTGRSKIKMTDKGMKQYRRNLFVTQNRTNRRCILWNIQI